MNALRLGACLVLLVFSPADRVHAEDTVSVSSVVAICVVCHGKDGTAPRSDDVPIIAGIPAPHIEEAVYAYQDEARRCVLDPVMCEAVQPLTEENIAEAADYFAALPRKNTGEEYNRHLAEAGKRLHEQHCAHCHVPPTDDDVADALGIPLHGQKAAYLFYAFESYRNGNRLTLIPQMAEKMALVDEDDVEALVNYYASYRP
jgi:cytochrome c553